MRIILHYLICAENSYLYIEAAKSFFNVPREKLSPRPLAAEADNLEDIKGCLLSTEMGEKRSVRFRERYERSEVLQLDLFHRL
jgi:hypothetical protein